MSVSHLMRISFKSQQSCIKMKSSSWPRSSSSKLNIVDRWWDRKSLMQTKLWFKFPRSSESTGLLWNKQWMIIPIKLTGKMLRRMLLQNWQDWRRIYSMLKLDCRNFWQRLYKNFKSKSMTLIKRWTRRQVPSLQRLKRSLKTLEWSFQKDSKSKLRNILTLASLSTKLEMPKLKKWETYFWFSKTKN